ncbi:aminoacetone oxidase family FAD-binding enzyme [Nitrosospira lacus]|uniref:Aminoacetone oxidase family FAD-binding enzyme n=1 Tax=Nitrosospira lacus TaxID=1288494 RepID=A0A1W6SMA5_9PROT|nr:aminoacetone oxidase family FAD-binding enzyme [Nitrosospira lacus]
MKIKKDVIVIGAGAAGMMCAIEAGKRGRSVMLLDHASKLAEKIRISGGGRCNFTNRHTRPENFRSHNPHFCRSALARFTPQNFVMLVEKHGIHYHEKKLGQLFCDGSSQQIIDLLRQECDAAGVEWQIPCRVNNTSRIHAGIAPGGRFLLETDRGILTADSLVIATGGLSIPQIGASPFGYHVARQFGIAVTPLRPALVPLTLSLDQLATIAGLPGVAIDAAVSCNGACFRENLLFTHRGLSGPAILQVSSYWQPGVTIHVDLLPDLDAAWLLDHRHSPGLLSNLIMQYLPRRFAQAWCDDIMPGQSARPINQYSEAGLKQIAAQLHDWQIMPSGTAGYKKAEVTLGGVDTRELSSKTMEARKIPGLYFIGEVVDVTGHLGGFNFQWAWSSGYAAGQFV